MADVIKYISIEKLGYYDQKIKSYIDNADDALKTSLEGQVEVVANALDGEIARAKAAEQANATAASNAQTAADNLAGKVGTVPENQTVMGIIANIQENAYDDTEVRGLISGLDTNKADKTQVATDIAAAVKVETDARVEAVAGVQGNVDTLSQTVASNKTAIENTVSTLEEKVDANETDIEGKMAALTNRVAANETAVGTTLPNSIAEVKNTADAAKASIDAFLKEADATETAIDTLKEIQAELAAGDASAASMLASINQNASDIGALETAVAKKAEQTALESEVTNRTNADDALSARITTLENAVGDGGSVAEDISTAKQEAVDAAAADATAKADKALEDAKSYADGLNTAMDERMDVVEAKAHEHSNKALLDTYTQTEVNLADAVAKKHAHSNLEVLEGITSAKISTWDTVTTMATSAALNAEVSRAEAKEAELQAAIDAIQECTQAEIDALFA